MLSHRHIEVFRAIMTAGSVTGAARLLATSQPTVSRELAHLEQRVGFALFERGRGRLRPTARALALYQEVERAYLGLERVNAMARQLRDFEAGALSVACLPLFAHALLPGACRRFLAQYPDVGVAIVPQEPPLLDEWLSAQRHDLGLVEQEAAPPGTRLEPLLTADEVCVLPAGHALLQRPLLQPQDFAGQPFISLAPADPYRVQLDALFAQAGVERRLRLETHSAVSVCAMVRQGLGLAIVNPLTALELAGAGLEIRPFAVSVPYRVSMVWPEFRAANPLAATLADALRAEAGELRARLATCYPAGI